MTGAANQQGFFSGGLSAGIGIDSGILLTSGSVNNAPGPNNSGGETTSVDTAGDSDLNGLIPGYTTDDANILQFDFTTGTGALYFNYVFGSEEYNEYVGKSFNDVFGFFVNGANIALIPNTTTPVSINNVNNGSNSAYYVNNSPATFNIQYDGFTNVLTAGLTGLTAGTTYTMKLAIADAGDTILDSGVFLQAGSFSGTNPAAVPEPATLTLLGFGLAGLGSVARRRRKA